MTLLTAWSIFGGFVVLFLPETAVRSKAENQGGSNANANNANANTSAAKQV